MSESVTEQQPDEYTIENTFEALERGDAVEVETTGTAGDQSFTARVTRTEHEDLLGDAELVRIEMENRNEGWTLQAERSSSDEPYGFLYACGASEGQRVEVVRPQFEEVDSLEEAEELLDRVEAETTMLECKTTGPGGFAGMVDTVRRFDRHEDEVQLRPWIGGSPIWGPAEELAPSLVGKPARIVEYEGVSA